jgi:mitogen-activated protein kinase kinase kinase 5
LIRRNENSDRDKALEILQRLCETKRTENELSNDITCLCGRIYKDKYTESDYRDEDSLEKAIEWYRRGFAADPNI